MVGKATPDRGGPRKRPLVEHLREQERHNVTVITVGSKYEVYVRSPAPSHMLTFRTLTNKVRGNYVVKEVFLCLPSCVFIMRRLFMHLSLMLCRCDAEWWCRWLYNSFTTPGQSWPGSNSNKGVTLHSPEIQNWILITKCSWVPYSDTFLGRCSRGIMVKAMDCGIVVSEFVFQLCYYFHFQANTLRKGMNPLILPAMD